MKWVYGLSSNRHISHLPTQHIHFTHTHKYTHTHIRSHTHLISSWTILEQSKIILMITPLYNYSTEQKIFWLIYSSSVISSRIKFIHFNQEESSVSWILSYCRFYWSKIRFLYSLTIWPFNAKISGWSNIFYEWVHQIKTE
jgi:hypothetical protein